MREPLYTLKDFAEKINVSINTLESRVKLGHKLPEPTILQKTMGSPFVKRAFKFTGKRYKLSELQEWYKTFETRNKNSGEENEENKIETT